MIIVVVFNNPMEYVALQSVRKEGKRKSLFYEKLSWKRKKMGNWISHQIKNRKNRDWRKLVKANGKEEMKTSSLITFWHISR